MGESIWGEAWWVVNTHFSGSADGDGSGPGAGSARYGTPRVGLVSIRTSSTPTIRSPLPPVLARPDLALGPPGRGRFGEPGGVRRPWRHRSSRRNRSSWTATSRIRLHDQRNRPSPWCAEGASQPAARGGGACHGLPYRLPGSPAVAVVFVRANRHPRRGSTARLGLPNPATTSKYEGKQLATSPSVANVRPLFSCFFTLQLCLRTFHRGL